MSAGRPAIPIKNIYYMLAYAFGFVRRGFGGQESVEAEKFDHIHNLLAFLLDKHVSRRVKRGLFRAYVAYNEELPTLRGKIDLPATMKLRLARKPRLACAYDELSEDNLLNRVIKTTALILLCHAQVEARYRAKLKNDLRYFSGVGTVAPATIDWAHLNFQRQNRDYEPMLNLCRLVLTGLLLTEEAGRLALAAYLDDDALAQLYEKFILEFYRVECPGLAAGAKTIQWALDDGQARFLPRMKTDITLYRGGRVLIIDAKCYQRILTSPFGRPIFNPGNLYQIFSYVKNLQANLGAGHDVAGMLLYAKTGEAARPDTAYRMSGNEISVQTLDLNRDFAEISAQLKAIAAARFGEGATAP